MLHVFKKMVLALFLFATGKAQWSENYSSPLLIGEGIKPQAATFSDGSTYITWITDGDYHVYVQRMDSLGIKQFGDQGLLVSDHDNASWIAVYHLNILVDLDGNAIISTVDQRTGTWEVYVWKISPDGNMLWGDEGIAVTNSSINNMSPRITIVEDNSLVVTCSHNDDEILFQRISADGELLWYEGILKEDDDNYLVSPQSIIDLNGDIIFQWIRQSPGWPIYSEIFIQKYDLNGISIWEDSVLVVGPTSFPMGDWSQQLVASGIGGSYSSWTQFSGSVQNAMVDKLDYDGTSYWGGAIEFSMNEDHFRMSPLLMVCGSSNELMGVWREANGSQSQRGIFAQRVGPSGERLWGDHGLPVVNLNTTYDYLDISISEFNDEIILTYLEQSSNMSGAIYAKRLDSMGNLVWENETIAITNSETQKSDVDVQKGLTNLIITWSENGSIYAHSFREDGSLGPPEIISISNCDSGFVEIDGLCFYEDDLELIQEMIDSSYESGIDLDCEEGDYYCGSPNPFMDDTESWYWNIIDGEEYGFADGDGIVEPLELGIQEWENGRLKSILCGAYVNCQLSGAIPARIHEWTEIDQFRFEGNYFSGFVPESICDLNLNFDDALSFDITSNRLCPPYPGCLNEYQTEGQDTTYCNQTFEWNFSIGHPEIEILGGQEHWAPGESVSIEMELCNDSEIGHMYYPGVVLESDSILTSIGNDFYWFYGMNADTCNDVYFNVTADSSIVNDTIITFSTYPAALNCENQPEYCIDGDTIVFEIPIVTDFMENQVRTVTPKGYIFHQNYPNPFNSSTTIRYHLPNDGLVKLTIYDILGNVVNELMNDYQNIGQNSKSWDGTNSYGQLVSAGIYYYTIQSDQFIESRKMILLK